MDRTPTETYKLKAKVANCPMDSQRWHDALVDLHNCFGHTDGDFGSIFFSGPDSEWNEATFSERMDVLHRYEEEGQDWWFGIAPQWRREFEDYPADAMPTIPEGWEDTSWHNDACPSFFVPEAMARIFVDFPDVADREDLVLPRFSVYYTFGQEDMADYDYSRDAVVTDIWDEVLEAVAVPKEIDPVVMFRTELNTLAGAVDSFFNGENSMNALKRAALHARDIAESFKGWE